MTTKLEPWQTPHSKAVRKRYARSARGKRSQKERTKRYIDKLAKAKALAERLGLWE